MRALIVALLSSIVAFSALAGLVMERGPLTVRLLDSDCTSDAAIEAIQGMDARSDPKRADVHIAGVFVPACWAYDDDGDVIVIDRTGEGATFYRRRFRDADT